MPRPLGPARRGAWISRVQPRSSSQCRKPPRYRSMTRLVPPVRNNQPSRPTCTLSLPADMAVL